jgi:hypothetical protein
VTPSDARGRQGATSPPAPVTLRAPKRGVRHPRLFASAPDEQSFFLYFVFSLVFFPAALIVAYCVRDRSAGALA